MSCMKLVKWVDGSSELNHPVLNQHFFGMAVVWVQEVVSVGFVCHSKDNTTKKEVQQPLAIA